MTRTPRARWAPRSARPLAAIVLPAACGVPTDDEPRAISREQRARRRGPDGELQDDGPAPELATLYFTRFDGGRDLLVPVERRSRRARRPSTPTPGHRAGDLLSGVPDDDAARRGLRLTKIPADDRARPASRYSTPTACSIVNLNSNISDVQGDGAALAFGQIVCTADALDEVEGVASSVEGEPARDATEGRRRGQREPLTCDSYANLREGADG